MDDLREDLPQRLTSGQAIATLVPWRAEKFLSEHVRNANLQSQGKTPLFARDLECSTNEQFWDTILGNRYLSLGRVSLVKFQVADWFPRSPGLYHTQDAFVARVEAERYLLEADGIQFYNPQGKNYMIKGGIGTIRFKPIPIEGEECWLCTATSDGYCDSGIPLAIPSRITQESSFVFDHLLRLTGQVRSLPEVLERHLRHLVRIPQIYVLVDSVERLVTSENPVKITPVVFFAHIGERSDREIGNVAYVTCRSDSFTEIDRAGEWLAGYVKRFSGRIITNYDQQRPAFEDAPFSLQNVMEGKLDPEELRLHFQNSNLIINVIKQINVRRLEVSKISSKNQSEALLRTRLLYKARMIKLHLVPARSQKTRN